MKTSLYNQHSEHTEWQNKLDFYKDEIKVMENRLAEVSQKNTATEIRMEIEHFQNQFLIQRDTISKISHHISAEEKQIQAEIKHNPVASDHRKAEDHVTEREMVSDFENNFTNLRKEYNTFLSKRF
ncbi:hypothetical protein CNR22_18680 [Sphingobacteriaceae bacterium]|nr:hypothetical protein CNR22_18680 [Sphingobacteriaceae bacterium]